MICSKCMKPVPDSFHTFMEVCKCINYKVKNKKGKDKIPKLLPKEEQAFLDYMKKYKK